MLDKSAETVGQRIKQLRLAAGWSQRELARRMVDLGDETASGTYVKNVEDGLYKPGSDRLTYFARLFGTTTDYLLTGIQPPGYIQPPPLTELRAVSWPEAEITELEATWSSYSEEQRLQILRAVREIYQRQQDTERQKMVLSSLLGHTKPVS